MRFRRRWGKHVTDDLSAFSDGILPTQESVRVSEHLRSCELCVKEYDEVRFGAALARHLTRASAPEGLWSSIERQWVERTAVALSVTERPRRLGIRWPSAATASFVLAFGMVVMRFALLRRPTHPLPASERASAGNAAGDSSSSTPSAPSAQFDLGPYLEPLKAASPQQSYRLISTASPGLVTVSKQEALRTAGLGALEKISPLPGYRLLAYRVDKMGESQVVQLIYGKGKEAFSVFVAPRQLRFSYGKETTVDTKIGGVRCQRVECPRQESYVFGEGRFRCALISKALTSSQVAAIMGYFISAHKRRKDDS